MDQLDQKDRPIGVETVLGPNVLVLNSFKGEEKLSDLFTFELDMFSLKGDIKHKDMLGSSISFWVLHQDESQRWFNGIVSSFSYLGQSDRGHFYHVEVVPKLWLLTRGSDSCVHETDAKQSAKDIICAILSKFGVTSTEWKVNRTLEKRQYCVQYGETHFDFVSRLLEEEGIYYYFVHEKGNHKLVFGDHGEAAYDAKDKEISMDVNLSFDSNNDFLKGWRHEYRFTTGKWAVNDYNFEYPTMALESNTSSIVSLSGNSPLEFYEFPGRYPQKGVGASLVKLRMEQEEAGHDVAHGSSICRSFSPGGRFTISKHHNPSEQGKKWLLTAVSHEASLAGEYYSGGQSDQTIYRNAFLCQPATVVYRPPRVRQKPLILGLHSGVVVGASGNEIDTDKYGRVKVQFPWNRQGKKDETASMWVRVATPWAGNKWGMIHVPRIGQEVLVSFLSGDPDQPVVTGMLYNGDNMPPYVLPDNKTQSGIKTRSSKDGTDENFNEIRFEDKKDSEQIYVHAEKDFDCVIENNETRKVGFDKKDKGDQTLEVYNDQTVKIGEGSKEGSQTVTIFKDRNVTLKTGNDSLTIEKGNMTVLLKGGNESKTLKKGNIESTLDMGNETTTLKMGNTETTLDMGNQTTTLKMGNQTTKLNLGKSSTDAMQSIELIVGANSIKVDQSGITLKGLMVNIEGTMKADVKSPMTTVSSAGIMSVKGGIVMIN